MSIWNQKMFAKSFNALILWLPWRWLKQSVKTATKVARVGNSQLSSVYFVQVPTPKLLKVYTEHPMGFDEHCVLQWETQVICLASKISRSVSVKFYQQEITLVNSDTEIDRFQFSFQCCSTTSTYITLTSSDWSWNHATEWARERKKNFVHDVTCLLPRQHVRMLLTSHAVKVRMVLVCGTPVWVTVATCSQQQITTAEFLPIGGLFRAMYDLMSIM